MEVSTNSRREVVLNFEFEDSEERKRFDELFGLTSSRTRVKIIVEKGTPPNSYEVGMFGNHGWIRVLPK